MTRQYARERKYFFITFHLKIDARLIEFLRNTRCVRPK